MQLQTVELLRRLTTARFDFVIIGGMAATAYGSAACISSLHAVAWTC
jgi:hypothetical protein